MSNGYAYLHPIQTRYRPRSQNIRTGASILYLATPFALGSLWALIPAGLTILLFIVRTHLEDRTLQAELTGYKAYTQQTRYRLIPGLW